MKDKINLSFVSNRPQEGDSPKLQINIGGHFYCQFFDLDAQKKPLVLSKVSNGNELILGNRQWFTNWNVSVKNLKNGETIFKEFYNAKNKVVFIKIDAYALGDNIAWVPYVEEFRKKHGCHVICSTFWNFLFEKTYPQIMFVAPNTQISNVYAQYYVGANEVVNEKYSPFSSINIPLQKVASSILGIEHVEIKPKISYPDNLKNNIGKKYVCISEFGSDPKKEWKEGEGWQTVVDFLRMQKYEVVVISKEKTNLKNIIDKSGDIHLMDRINDLLFCDFYIGVSSGLAWLAWALNKKVLMISDCTPHCHEFKENMFRVGQNKNGAVNYQYGEITTKKEVVNKINELIL